MQKILVITGSTRPNRRSLDVAKWFLAEAKTRKDDFELELADLADVNLPMFDEPKSPIFGDYKNDHTKKWAAKLASADGFVIVTPEYNHGYPAVLKNAIDYAYAEWGRKPVAFISYGVAGGVRAVEQLKQVFHQVEAAPLNAQVAFNLFTSWQNNVLTPSEQNTNEAQSLLDALKWWGEALKTARQKS